MGAKTNANNRSSRQKDNRCKKDRSLHRRTWSKPTTVIAPPNTDPRTMKYFTTSIARTVGAQSKTMATMLFWFDFRLAVVTGGDSAPDGFSGIALLPPHRNLDRRWGQKTR